MPYHDAYYDYSFFFRKDDEEKLEEGKPFLSALLQSTMPDDIFHDIR